MNVGDLVGTLLLFVVGLAVICGFILLKLNKEKQTRMGISIVGLIVGLANAVIWFGLLSPAIIGTEDAIRYGWMAQGVSSVFIVVSTACIGVCNDECKCKATFFMTLTGILVTAVVIYLVFPLYISGWLIENPIPFSQCF